MHTTSWLTNVAQYSDEVSVNPMNIQKNTIVDRLFRNKEYRPPWLWSLVEMILRSHDVLETNLAGSSSTLRQVERFVGLTIAGNVTARS